MSKHRNAASKLNSFDALYEATRFLARHRMNSKPVTVYEPDSSGKSSKGSVFYNTHSYPTKVPVDSIIQSIRANSNAGDLVVDPFCGSGMTGLAAKLSGRRSAISDIGTLALHLASNHVTPCDPIKFREAAVTILSKLNETSPYLVRVDGRTRELNYALYSDVIACPKCKAQTDLWDLGSKSGTGSVPSAISCAKCKFKFRRNEAKIARKSLAQAALIGSSGRLENVVGSDVKYINLRNNEPDLSVIGDIEFSVDREMYHRSALHLQQVSSLRDFYSDRNWLALSLLYTEISKVPDERVRAALLLAFTNTAWHGSKMRRYNAKGGHRPLTGTLYFPQLYSEANCFRVFENKIETLCSFFEALNRYGTNCSSQIKRASATDLSHLDDRSADYVYTDPPFGSNIFYADCNFIAEAWLGQPTDTAIEAVVNKSLKSSSGGKTLADYSTLMRDSFSEIRRILKPDSRASIVFNSSTGDVWTSLRDAFSDAGLELVNAGLLDKVQLSFKGYKAHSKKENVATTDVVLELRRTKKIASQRKFKSVTSTVLDKAYAEFKTNSNGAKRAGPSDFYAYLVKFCHLKGYSFEEVDMKSVSQYFANRDGTEAA